MQTLISNMTLKDVLLMGGALKEAIAQINAQLGSIPNA